jgi:hypothetical protein
MLRYQHPGATNVRIAGSWDTWTGTYPLAQSGEIWVLDTRSLPAPFGRHEFKFIVNDEWEKGENRFLYLNIDRMMEQPSDLLITATIDDLNVVTVHFRRGVKKTADCRVWIEPDSWARAKGRFLRRSDAPGDKLLPVRGRILSVFDPPFYG